MEHLRFRCTVCGQIVEMKKDVKPPFSDWGYFTCVQWSDFHTDVPALSEKHWARSDKIPAVGEKRCIFVQKPFDECIGNTFWAEFEPALLFFNGWDDYPEEEIEKCAMIRCQFERILAADETCAWIEVRIMQVIPLHHLYEHYIERITTESLDDFKEFRAQGETMFRNDHWRIVGWSAQGDCGETKWIYTDETGRQHLVLASWFGFDEEVLYIGNVISAQNHQDTIT